MWTRRLLGLLVAAACAVDVAAQRAPVRPDRELLIEIEHAWNDAVYSKKIAVVENILAEEFIGTYADGSRGDKARELALIRDFDQQVESARQDDFTVQVYGDAAVVWFTLRLVGLRQGQRAEVSYRYTDVFVRRDGRWQCVSSHSTRIAP